MGEAGDRSVALITADFALEQGAKFLQCRAMCYRLSSGTSRLIQNGAYAMISPQDVFDVLNLDQIDAKKMPDDCCPRMILKQAFKVIDYQPKHIDEICNETDLAIEKVSAALTLMELRYAQHVGGMRYASFKI